jgi:hypothetical protein
VSSSWNKLEQRLEAVERRGLEYLGVWRDRVTYKRGDAVTCDAAIWVAGFDLCQLS